MNKKFNSIFVLILILFSLQISYADYITDTVKNNGNAVVLIGTFDKDKKPKSLGSGFIAKPDGIIITNFHVIEGVEYASIKLLNGEIYDVVGVIDYDSTRDIAVIKVKASNLPCVKMGNSNNIKIGEKVVAIGNPEGLQNSVSDGLISSVRNIDGIKMLQISAPISHGSSGGALFNQTGMVIGITTSSIVEGQNLNFAVPINYVLPLIGKEVKYKLSDMEKAKNKTNLSPKTSTDIKKFKKIYLDLYEQFYSGLVMFEKGYEDSFKNESLTSSADPKLYSAKEIFEECRDLTGKLPENDPKMEELKDNLMKVFRKLNEGTTLIISDLEDKENIINFNLQATGIAKIKTGETLFIKSIGLFYEIIDNDKKTIEKLDEIFFDSLPNLIEPGSKYTGIIHSINSNKYIVAKIVPNSPAEKTELQPNDRIITVDNNNINLIEDFNKYVNRKNANDSINIVATDVNNKEKTVILKLEKFKNNEYKSDVIRIGVMDFTNKSKEDFAGNLVKGIIIRNIYKNKNYYPVVINEIIEVNKDNYLTIKEKYDVDYIINGEILDCGMRLNTLVAYNAYPRVEIKINCYDLKNGKLLFDETKSKGNIRAINYKDLRALVRTICSELTDEVLASISNNKDK